jgi:hypothetical protein
MAASINPVEWGSALPIEYLTTRAAAPGAATSGRSSIGCSRTPPRRQFDVVMAWSVDRLGRSLQDPSGTFTRKAPTCICTFRYRNHDARRQGAVPDEGEFAEFERAIVQERVCAGLAKARAKGKRLGLKPPKCKSCSR